MNRVFQTAAGSVIGHDHVRTGKNNHDAWFVQGGFKGDFVALVADGCGSGLHSEVGAKLGVQMLGEAIISSFYDGTGQCLRMNKMLGKGDFELLLRHVRKDVLKTLNNIMSRMVGRKSFTSVANDFFLFTIVGAIILPEVSVFFSLGDGTMIVNGEKISLGPFQDNAPPYLMYGSEFVKTALKETNPDPDALNFTINRILPTEELENFLIGTDGLDYLAAASEENLPGKSEQVGPLSQFWEEDRFFANPDMVRRRLSMINTDFVTLDRQAMCIKRKAGLLFDDTTLIVGRRILVKGET